MIKKWAKLKLRTNFNKEFFWYIDKTIKESQFRVYKFMHEQTE